MTEHLTPQQLKEFRERIDEIMAYYKTQSNERIIQRQCALVSLYLCGVITREELGRCLTTLPEK